MSQSKFQRGDQVIDSGGREGTVVAVTEWRGSTWYDVRLGPQGVAVRYDYELQPRNA